MMTMSKSLGVAQAQNYYQQEYAAGAAEGYYTDGEQLAGEWQGLLAEEWGVAGAGIESEQFDLLCDGRDPVTGEQRLHHVAAKTYENRYGQEITSSEHRAGWDATFSAPKSVSLAAIVGGDERIREAHRESVAAALQELEKCTQARIGGNHPAQTTGKLIAAKFEHDAARPDRESGYAAPQLHTHVVIFNMTELADGRTRSVQPLELYRSQQLATAIYRSHLAEALQRLGYEVEIDARTGAPEIKGFSREYLEASSPRRAEVKQAAAEMKERLEQDGGKVKEGAGLNQAAARADRAGKGYDRAEMRERALALEAAHGHQAVGLHRQAIERGPLHYTPEQVGRRAQEAVTFARDNAVEREAVTDMRKLMVDALRRNLGLTTLEAVKLEVARHAKLKAS